MRHRYQVPNRRTSSQQSTAYPQPRSIPRRVGALGHRSGREASLGGPTAGVSVVEGVLRSAVHAGRRREPERHVVVGTGRRRWACDKRGGGGGVDSDPGATNKISNRDGIFSVGKTTPSILFITIAHNFDSQDTAQHIYGKLKNRRAPQNFRDRQTHTPETA